MTAQSLASKSSSSSNSSFDDLPDINEAMTQPRMAPGSLPSIIDLDLIDNVPQALAEEAIAFLGEATVCDSRCPRCLEPYPELLSTARDEDERSLLEHLQQQLEPDFFEYRSGDLCIFCRREVDEQAFAENPDPVECRHNEPQMSRRLDGRSATTVQDWMFFGDRLDLLTFL